MVDVSQIEVLEKEAYANLSVQRYRDAAKTYEHLISLALRLDDYEKALYYAIQAATCWRNDDNTINRILMFKHIGEMAATICAKLAADLAQKSKDQKVKIRAMMIEAECLEWQYPNKAKQRYKEILTMLKKLEKEAKDVEKKVSFSRTALEVLDKIGTKSEIKNKREELATAYVEMTKKEIAKKTPEGLQKAIQNLEDALKLYKELKAKDKIEEINKRIEKLKKKIEELDPFKL